MPDRDMSDAVRRFVESAIDSIEQLEVLLLLRSTAEREWSAVEISGELGSTPGSIQRRLADLASRGLVAARESEGHVGHRFAPASEELAALVDAVAHAYKHRRLSIINLIYARPPNQVRSFSDAFLLSKKKGDT